MTFKRRALCDSLRIRSALDETQMNRWSRSEPWLRIGHVVCIGLCLWQNEWLGRTLNRFSVTWGLRYVLQVSECTWEHLGENNLLWIIERFLSDEEHLPGLMDHSAKRLNQEKRSLNLNHLWVKAEERVTSPGSWDTELKKCVWMVTS